MLFSINILFVIPKITAIETIDDPPKLNKGKGKPVTGIKPTTVDIFIIIWKDSSAINPAITNLSKHCSFFSEEDLFDLICYPVGVFCPVGVSLPALVGLLDLFLLISSMGSFFEETCF